MTTPYTDADRALAEAAVKKALMVDPFASDGDLAQAVLDALAGANRIAPADAAGDQR